MNSTLIIGGQGYLGRGLQNFFRSKDLNFKVWDKKEELFSLTTKDLEKMGIQQVINLAMYPANSNKYIDFNSESFKLNIMAAGHISDITYSLGIPNIFFSTREVIGYQYKKDDVFWEGEKPSPKIFVDESFETLPNGEYGKSKLVGEWLTLSRENGTVIRLSTPYTSEADTNFPSLVTKLIGLSVLKNSVKLVNNGITFRDPLHVDDIGEFLLKFIFQTNLSSKTNIFHLGNHERGFLTFKAIVQLANSKVEILNSVGSDYGFAMDYTRAKNMYNWKPKHNFEEDIVEISEKFKRIKNND
jgi:dTDP-4-dehydrorhamnose reductase